MSTQPYNAMVGYYIWIEIETMFRSWLSQRLFELFGAKWSEQVPPDILDRLRDRYNEQIDYESTSTIHGLLEFSDFPDLFSIIKFRKKLKTFFSDVSPDDIDYYSSKLYSLRNQIAHRPNSFGARNLEEICEAGDWIATILGPFASSLKNVIADISSSNDLYHFALPIPQAFSESILPSNSYKIPNNLPSMDYEFDGGFVGRRSERNETIKLLKDKRIYPVITISGAGGVGKTALAHNICDEILRSNKPIFDALIWLSGKKDKLTERGIEDVDASIKSYEDVLDEILSQFNFHEYIDTSLHEKEQIVDDVILREINNGILLVIDNLETMMDDTQLIEFIKRIPTPNKALITSRLGLGEVEKRIPLKQLTIRDAIELFRKFANEKSLISLARLSDNTIREYIDKMSAYPLVIKWIIGQAAVNQDFDRLVSMITRTDSDIARFCFQYIYESLLQEVSRLVLIALSMSNEDLPQSVLMHVIELSNEEFSDVMRELELASLVVPTTQETQGKIETVYGLLPLTRGYLRSFNETEQTSRIRERLQALTLLFEKRTVEKHSYELSLENYGAETQTEIVAGTYIARAFHRMNSDDFVGALTALKRAEDIAPTFSTVYRSRAVFEGKNGNYKTAVENFEHAVRLRREDPITWFHWGNLEKRFENYTEAREKYKLALEFVEHRPTVLIELGNIATRDIQFEDAVKFYLTAIEELNSNPDILRESGGNRSIVADQRIVASTALASCYIRWSEYLESTDLPNAISLGKKGLNLIEETEALVDLHDKKINETKTKALLHLGRLHWFQGDVDGATQYLSEAIESNSSDSGTLKYLTLRQKSAALRILHYLTLCFIVTKQFSEARRLHKEASSFTDADPQFAQKHHLIHYYLDSITISRGKFYKIVNGKGYGFLETENQSDIFAHVSQLLDDVAMDMLQDKYATFVIVSTDKGKEARAILVNY